MEEDKTAYPSSENVLSFGGRDRQDLGSYADEAIGMPGMSAETEKVFHREESFSEKKTCTGETLPTEEPERTFFSDLEFHQYTEEELKLEPKKVSWLDARNDAGDEVPERQFDDDALKQACTETEFLAEAPEQAFFSDMEFRQYAEEELKLKPEKFSWLWEGDGAGDEELQQQPENILQQPDDYTRTGIPLPENLGKWEVMKVCLQDYSDLSNESARLNRKIVFALMVLISFMMISVVLIPTVSELPVGMLLSLGVVVIMLCVGGFHRLAEEKLRRIYPVLSSGKRTEAVITRCRKGRRIVNIVPLMRRSRESDLYWLETVWRFTDESGKAWKKTVCYPATKEYFIPEGSRGYVCYNPDNPRESIWIGKNWKRFCLFYDPELA